MKFSRLFYIIIFYVVLFYIETTVFYGKYGYIVQYVQYTVYGI